MTEKTNVRIHHDARQHSKVEIVCEKIKLSRRTPTQNGRKNKCADSSRRASAPKSGNCLWKNKIVATHTYPEWPKKQMSPDEKSELTTQKWKFCLFFLKYFLRFKAWNVENRDVTRYFFGPQDALLHRKWPNFLKFCEFQKVWSFWVQ